MLRRGSIYCEAVSQPQDIYYEGSEDEDYDDAVTRRQRCEAAGQQFLAGRAPLLLSATLRGPFGEESGWVNPWRSKHRTAHSQRRPPESQCAGSQHSHRRPAASALVEKRAMEALKSAEYALPSPESLKQAPLTKARSHLQGKGAAAHDWSGDAAPPPLSDDDFWEAISTPKKPNKRKSRASQWLNSATSKRQRIESLETDVATTPLGRSRTMKAGASNRFSRTKASVRDSSIYSHIRALTSRLPTGALQNLSSEDEGADDADGDEAACARPSLDLSLTNATLPSEKRTPSKALYERENSSSLVSSPFSRLNLLRAFSPVSISPAQTPTKKGITKVKSSSHRRSASGPSFSSEAPTGLSNLSDREMIDVDCGDEDDEGEDQTISTILPEHQSQEDHPLSPEALGTSDSGHVSGILDSILPATPTVGSNNGRTPLDSDAGRIMDAEDDIHLDDLEPSYDLPRGYIMSFRTTPPCRTAVPLIYDDAQGSDQLAPESENMALSGSRQFAANEHEPIVSPRLEKRKVVGDGNLSTASSPRHSSALQSLSPRNVRINSQPALKKIARPYSPSRRRSPKANADEALYSQQQDGGQSKENFEAMVANEKPQPLPTMVNATSLAASQPSPDEVVTDMNCEQDHSTPDDDQEEPLAHDSPAPVLSTVLCSNLLPAETVSSAETEQTAQADVLPNILEQAESIPSQQELSADSQAAIPMEHAYPDILERHANRGASEMPNEPLLTAPVTDGHSWAHQQEQQDETRPFPVATESPVTPSKSIDTHQPAPEDLPKSTEQALKRPSTPEPQFIFSSFASFMSPSPNHRRRAYRPPHQNPNSAAHKSQGILTTSMNKSWRSTRPKKTVSWAPLPHGEAGSAGERVSSEMDTSSSLSRGRERAVSPPPPSSAGLSSDSLAQGGLTFGHHFAAIAHRSKGTRLQRVPSMPEQVSRDPEEQASAEDFAAARGEKKVSASQPSAWDDEDPTDVIQDMFNEMNDFLQVWDIDAELDEARKADKTRVTSKRGA